MSLISPREQSLISIKSRRQDSERIIRIGMKPKSAHLRQQSGRVQTVWVFFQNLLYNPSHGVFVTLTLGAILCTPTFLTCRVIERPFKHLNCVNFSIALEYKPRVFRLQFLNFRR